MKLDKRLEAQLILSPELTARAIKHAQEMPKVIPQPGEFRRWILCEVCAAFSWSAVSFITQPCKGIPAFIAQRACWLVTRLGRVWTAFWAAVCCNQ